MTSGFHSLLQKQVGNEFAASHQYVALAIWFDNEDFPTLANHFYKQALEERNHAMMLVQYLMDNDVKATIPSINDVVNDFKTIAEPVELALKQEKQVTDQIIALAKAARADNDYLGEQFMQWFLKEQVEEVASMTTLLNVIERANGNTFDVENWLARNAVSVTADPTAPAAAGGAV
jgi:ferritin